MQKLLIFGAFLLLVGVACAREPSTGVIVPQTSESRSDAVTERVNQPIDGGGVTPASQLSGVKIVVKNCPMPPYEVTGQRTVRKAIRVPAGEIAFIDAAGFDGYEETVFVTITGPYSGEHMITAGAFCGGIPADSDYELVKKQRESQVLGARKIFLP